MTSASLVGSHLWRFVSHTDAGIMVCMPSVSEATIRKSADSFAAVALTAFVRKTGQSAVDADPLIAVRRLDDSIAVVIGRPNDANFDAQFKLLLPRPQRQFMQYEITFTQ